MGIGPWELVVILVIVVIIFGVGKLPEVGSGLGEGIRNFKRALNDTGNTSTSNEPEKKNSKTEDKN